jgi:hypothetical protein
LGVVPGQRSAGLVRAGLEFRHSEQRGVLLQRRLASYAETRVREMPQSLERDGLIAFLAGAVHAPVHPIERVSDLHQFMLVVVRELEKVVGAGIDHGFVCRVPGRVHDLLVEVRASDLGATDDFLLALLESLGKFRIVVNYGLGEFSRFGHSDIDMMQ